MDIYNEKKRCPSPGQLIFLNGSPYPKMSDIFTANFWKYFKLLLTSLYSILKCCCSIFINILNYGIPEDAVCIDPIKSGHHFVSFNTKQLIHWSRCYSPGLAHVLHFFRQIRFTRIWMGKWLNKATGLLQLYTVARARSFPCVCTLFSILCLASFLHHVQLIRNVGWCM